MRDIGIMGGRATLALLFLGLVGVLTLLRIGNKRGTRAYRARIALWSMAVMLTAGTAMLAAATSAEAETKGEGPPDGTPAIDEAPAEYADPDMVSCYCTVGPWH